MRALFIAIPVLIALVAMLELRAPHPAPLGSVRVRLDDVPPDACLELFGPGPCRPHGAAPTTGWTDAVAGPPPDGWRGKVR